MGLLDALGDDGRAYSAEALRTFVLNRARPHGNYRAKSIVVAVRAFVRFLGVTGRCPVGMEHALSGFASWQLASVPRFLAAQDAALDHYLGARRRLAVKDDHKFFSAGNQRIASSTVERMFRRIRRLAAITPPRTRPPRIHDLRHTFATRALEKCSTRRETVARYFVALATYMGHSDIAYTYWYLEATPELMTHITAAAEELIAREGI